MKDKQLVFLCIITERRLKDELIERLSAVNAALIDFVYGYGYHERHGIMDMLGFGEKRGKIVLTCLITKEHGDDVIGMLNEEYRFGQPGTGIAFTVPIEKLVY